MLTFVNEELFSYSPKIEKNNQSGKDVLQLSVATSNFLVTYAKGSKMDKYNNPQENQEINTAHDIDMRDNPKIEPINREILCVKYISDDQLKNPSLLTTQATSLKVIENQRGIPMVSIRCLKKDTPNKSDLYVIAFPFNGMILPIAEDPKYRIYKGMIMSSVRPFYYNNRRYRKILYLVIEPHRALFDPNHKYHTDVIKLTLESFAIFKDRETGDEKTNHETFELNMCSNNDITTAWTYETMNEAKRIEPDLTTPLWITFKFNPKTNNYKNNSDASTQNDHSRQNNKLRNGQKTGYVEGNTYVTTNKHGIRKEIPINNVNGGNRNSRGSQKSDNLDRMMQDSGMFDEDYDHDNRRGNRGKKNKKKNNRNNYDYWN